MKITYREAVKTAYARLCEMTSAFSSWEKMLVVMAGLMTFDELDVPVARVCSAEVPMPYARHLEDAALPQVTKITEAVLQMF